ncbi:bacillithiol biosynthesis cysteine-adding enzyme BshC [Paenibacillus sp. CF384]|uniref:bacillithiol biosynthesis cysteine-adding enzyme BshC n=1 Tax=Paenibacillus sp. CF384 TaxID=1884382 RepID=UPI00089AC8E4|nr:bacillithiol biosynthesis cysteine-adding enzyme BshC [Paenibacillus sp. CF384]SDW87278.1 bacillithiol biosynthesis cysteine-adding enzyme BshC [Paenibacillus sp. CF384]
MIIDTVQLPFGQPVTEAYIHRSHPGVEALFGSHAAEHTHWKRRMSWLSENAHKRTDARLLGDTLQTYNTRYNNEAAVMANIDAIRSGAPVIVTGQQAGLWTGPMLVIHKAVTTISAAKEASARLGSIVVPVFWIAGEDHDFDEVNHAYVRGEAAALTRLAVQRPKGARTAVSRTKITQETFTEAVQLLSTALPDTSFKPELLEKLGQFAKQSETLSELFAYLLGWLFGSQGLILLDADDAAIRKLEAPMFGQMLARNDELESAYFHSASQLREHGFTPAADVTQGSANLFLFDEEERILLHKQEGQYRNRKGTKSWPVEQLREWAEHEPQRFSNNVLTRPIMQDYVLPVLAAVLGPGEVAYWSLTGEAFKVLGMQMPIVVPRMSFTLVEDKTSKYMSKYGLSFEEVAFRFKACREAWLKERDETGIEAGFAAALAGIEALYEPVKALTVSVENGLGDLTDQNLLRIKDQISYLEKRTMDAHAKKFGAALRQLDWIALSLWPEGKPQERVLNMMEFYNSYGRSWIDKLLDIPYDQQSGHHLISI